MLKRKRRERKLILICLIVMGWTLILNYLFNTRIGPQIVELASSGVEFAAKNAINNAVTELMEEDGLSYSDIITFEKTDSGEISALKTNMAELNRVKTALTGRVLESVMNISVEEIAIPLGSLTSTEFLSARGPDIPVKIVTARTVAVDFLNDFTDAGINQTIHRIYVDISMEMTIMSAGRTVTVEVSSQYCLAETVIVGSVPDSYTYFSEVDSAEEAAENYFNFG